VPMLIECGGPFSIRTQGAKASPRALGMIAGFLPGARRTPGARRIAGSSIAVRDAGASTKSVLG
jgi:hypothetical protein